MDWLEAVTDLDRNLECLPSTEQLHTRLQTGAGLTSPELSVLAAYAKIELARELTHSGLADDPWFSRTLRDYFPRQLSERFGEELSTHPLRRQIVATVIANDMINLGGIAFAFRAMEETTVSAAAVARGFVVMRKIWDFDSITEALAQLPASIPSEHGCAVALDMRRTAGPLDTVVCHPRFPGQANRRCNGPARAPHVASAPKVQQLPSRRESAACA